jgi:hypothetical protein
MIAENPPPSPRLVDFGCNKFSQFGEDGVIHQIFALIGTTSRVCIEFGAWDGFHLSNTANLWTQGWKGILIEGHRRRFQSLMNNVGAYDCICINAYVAADGNNRLEALLQRERIANAIDLLSIDIDGDDYYILESLEALRPRVIICEYNPTIPAHIDLYAPYGSNFGASVAALTRVAEGKGYKLIALTKTNCFFLRMDEDPKLAGFARDLASLRDDSTLTYLMSSYSGEYVASDLGPYGRTFPYRGVLIGPHDRFILRSKWQRLVYDILKIAKRTAKRLLRRD